jgi:hypothetical protein
MGTAERHGEAVCGLWEYLGLDKLRGKTTSMGKEYTDSSEKKKCPLNVPAVR